MPRRSKNATLPSQPHEVKRLLIVEDDAALGRLTARCFQRAGYAVRVALSVENAEREDTCCDCGVFDIHLADGDGVSLATKMLKSGQIRSVVFYSGALAPADVRRAKAVGSFVLKPARFEVLAAGVAAAIRRYGG